ncbi:MAG: glutamine-hydrolyzing GMP synthase [Clostridia bacterium]|nr:glutamine-hydrolyzing GMP synthase [Clostridia bacterium]
MDKILVLDFGGQYDQLIARRVRAAGVYAEIERYGSISCEGILSRGFRGIIFTGGPNSVYAGSSPKYDAKVLGLGIPVLGICYGHQLLAYLAGGTIAPAQSGSEYGRTELRIPGGSPLFQGVPEKSVCWMSHSDAVAAVPEGFETLAGTDSCPCAAMGDEKRKLYGVQFHPEVTHTEYGETVLKNFVFGICGCSADWRMGDVLEQTVEKYRRELSGQRVLLGLSGGVDSSVAAALLQRAVGDGLTCVFVDHGLLRKGEGDLVEKTFGERLGKGFVRVDAQERFLRKLRGVTDPETKRRIIGEEFIRVFEEEAAKLGRIDVLAQGTIYPDVIESGKGDSAVIKSHHNVGGLPERMSFGRIAEPLRELFKDEVRELGEELGLPRELVRRQPFPGPGLGVRIVGEVTNEKLDMLREADAVFREELESEGLNEQVGQYFAALTDTKSVGVMGDARTYGYVCALRAVTTDDFMTASWTHLPYGLLERVSSRITNEVPGITRVVYDITSKPPATVEWE